MKPEEAGPLDYDEDRRMIFDNGSTHAGAAYPPVLVANCVMFFNGSRGITWRRTSARVSTTACAVPVAPANSADA